MLDDRRILAVVPARGGSKGVKLKNIQPLRGVPLVAHVGPLLRALGYVDRAVVSTDHDEIARVAEAAGLAAPFRRPPELAGDRIGDLDVLAHALLEMERFDAVRYDVVLMLQPTSPLRRPEHVDATVRKLLAERLDAVWTVSPTDLKYHPLKQLTLDPSSGLLHYFDPQGAAIVARQQLAPVYHRNGACYALARDCLLEQRTTMGRRTGAVVVDEPMISIDTLEDFDKVERALAAREA